MPPAERLKVGQVCGKARKPINGHVRPPDCARDQDKAGGKRLARRLVLAIGVADDLPVVPSIQERWVSTVLHCPYRHGYEVRDEPLRVLAAHLMSSNQALLMPDWGPTKYCTQGEYDPEPADMLAFAALGETVERTPVVELPGDAPSLDAVRLADGRIIKQSALFTAPQTQSASPLAEL